MLTKINLGCESQIIPGFLNFDVRYKQFVGSLYWEWNKPIPCADDSAELILVQHVLMYLSPQDYDKNLQEIYRVLCPEGILIIKEENNLKYRWRKLGTKHKTGHIVSSTNPEEMVEILKRNKFKIISQDAKAIVIKYNVNRSIMPIINRLPKLFANKIFIIESKK